jgi:hypothetical protein
MATEYPEKLDLEIIYSHDDEGNCYQKVYSVPNFCQVHDIKEHYLEMVGHYNGHNDEIALEDCNAVIIN